MENSKTAKITAVTAVISVAIMALTFLFGDGIMLPLLAKSSADGRDAAQTDTASPFPEVTGVSGNDIRLENTEVTDSGFYAEYDGDTVEMDGLVLHGNFSYSKPLSDEDKQRWSHGGSLYDIDGNECYTDRIRSWSNYNAMQFAVELPEDMEKGAYTYQLYHYIGSRRISAEVDFIIE